MARVIFIIIGIAMMIIGFIWLQRIFWPTPPTDMGAVTIPTIIFFVGVGITYFAWPKRKKYSRH